MKKLLMALVPVLMFGCGGDPEDVNGDGIADGVQDPNNVSVVVPATPKGTVSGQVLTTQQKPIEAVTVAMTIGSSTTAKTATTDAAGNFTFQDVPGGAQVLLTISKEGFSTMRASATVPTTAGNVPINNGNVNFGPVVLSQTNATVRFTVIAPTGRPAEGVKGTLVVENAGTVLFGSASSTTSTVVGEATADAQGVFTFANMPDPGDIARLGGSYQLIIAAHDSNGDGILESIGFVNYYSGEGLITGSNAKPIELSYAYSPGTPLRIDFSNFATLKGGSSLPQYNMLKPGDSIYVVFNQPVQSNSIVVGLTDEYGKESLSITKTLSNGGTVLTLTPPAVTPGKEYNLYYRAVSVSGGTYASNTIAFFGGDPASPQNISVESVRFQEGASNNGLIDNLEVVYVNFNQALTTRLVTPTYAYAYIGADLNASGKIGDATGERDPATGRTLSPTSGFLLSSAEPTDPIATKSPPEKAVFPLRPSGYTTRFRFTYQPPTATTTFNPTSNIPIYLAFGVLNPTFDVYESAWGVSQTTDITINGSSVAPIAVPVVVP